MEAIVLALAGGINLFVDVHCHLYMLRSIEETLNEAEKLGVTCLITNSEDLESSRKNLELLKDKRIYGAFGLHPKFAHKEEELQKIMEFLELDKAVAVGEVGLDYKFAKKKSERRLQMEVFERQIEKALEIDLPLIVHSRYAHEQVISTLEKFGAEKVVLHWFNGSLSLVKRALRNGWFFSFGPFSLSDAYEEMIKIVPLERALLETDSPVPFRGKRVDPTWIPRIARRIAEVKGISFEEVKNKVLENSRRLFELIID